MEVISFETHPILATIISLLLMIFFSIPVLFNWHKTNILYNDRYKVPTEYRRNIDEK